MSKKIKQRTEQSVGRITVEIKKVREYGTRFIYNVKKYQRSGDNTDWLKTFIDIAK